MAGRLTCQEIEPPLVYTSAALRGDRSMALTYAEPALEPEQREAAKDVIVDLIDASDGCFIGKTRLYKAFYFAHLYYWRHGPGILTDCPIVRMPYGPGIDKGDQLLAELENEGRISILREEGPFGEPEFSYLLARDPREFNPGNPRDWAIGAAASFVKNKSARELSEYTHDKSRSWRLTESGQELSIYMDLLGEDEYIQLRESVDSAGRLVESVFGDL